MDESKDDTLLVHTYFYGSKVPPMCYLPRSLHSLPEAEVYDSENEEKAEHELPANAPDVVQPRRLVHLKNVSPVTTKMHKIGKLSACEIRKMQTESLALRFSGCALKLFVVSFLTLTCTYV